MKMAKVEEFKVIDEHFKSIYEMEFEKFREILKIIIRLGLTDNDDFETLLDDFKLWKMAKVAEKGVTPPKL